VRELEDALATLQAQSTDEPHPLLQQSVLKSPEGKVERDVIENQDGNAPAAHEILIDAFGTLHITDHGISRFFGPTGGSESLLIVGFVPMPASSCF
jgi:hypothetical protein